MNCNNKDYESPDQIMKILKVFGFVILGIVVVVGLGFVIMLLWNWLMPMLFGLIKITYWQGLGILALSSILFGRLGGGGGSKDDDDKKKGKTSIRKEIGREIEKEIRKEVEKEYGNKDSEQTEQDEPEKANEEYEEMYDKWWKSEGEKRFEDYLSPDDTEK